MKDVEYGAGGLMPMVRPPGSPWWRRTNAGLGTPGPHQYEQQDPRRAYDVVYSIPAAHRSGAIARRKIGWRSGIRKAALAVWGVAELEAQLGDAGYAGGISVAGDMDFDAYETTDAGNFDPVNSLYWPMTAFGIHASYPSFDVSRMLTPQVLARYRDITPTKGCWYYAYALTKVAGPRRRCVWDGTGSPKCAATMPAIAAPTSRSRVR